MKIPDLIFIAKEYLKLHDRRKENHRLNSEFSNIRNDKQKLLCFSFYTVDFFTETLDMIIQHMHFSTYIASQFPMHFGKFQDQINGRHSEITI